ncbi:hypothetical protein BKA70DRAFT_1430269 [Coprinopsis sp. MPI-PUGE-AT-0042]|nr:hypothetical protein BKA70DRAFT_1430269 [Coprinopsis sp. MPI-PUGE-AT-0042]
MFSSLRSSSSHNPSSSPPPTYVIPCSLSGRTPASTPGEAPPQGILITSSPSPSASSSSSSSSPEAPLTPPQLTEHLTHSPLPPPEFGSPRQLVRFDTECVLIPELGSKYYKQLAKSRSRSRSLTRSRSSHGHAATSSSGTEDEGTTPGKGGKTRLVVQNRSFKLPLWSSPSKGSERVKINFKVPLPVLERGRRSRSPSPVPPSPSILRERDPLPSIHVSSTPAIQIPTPGSYTTNPIYTNPHTHVSPPSSPIVAPSSSTSPAIPSVLHTQLSGTPPVPPHPTTPTAAAPLPGAPALPVSTTPLRPCCPDCLPSLHSFLSSCTSGSPWEEKYTKGAVKRMRNRSSSVASYASGDEPTVWMGEGGVISPTVMGGVLPGEGLPGVVVAPTTTAHGLNLDKPLPVPQDLLKISESEQDDEDLDASPLAPCLKPIAVDEVDKKIRERCSLDGHSSLPQDGECSLLKGGIGGPCTESDGENEDFHDASQGDRDEEDDSSDSSSDKEQESKGQVKVLPSKPITSPSASVTTSGTVTPTASSTLTPTRPTFPPTPSSNSRPSSYHSASPSHSGTSTPTPASAHPKAQYVLAPPIVKSTSGSSTPTKSILKNASQGGGRILSDAEVEAREERRKKRREERMRREVEERLAAAAAAAGGADDDGDEGEMGRRTTQLRTTTVHEDYVLVSSAGQSSESSDEGSRPLSRSSSRSSRSSRSSKKGYHRGVVKKEWDMSLGDGDAQGGLTKKGNKRHSFPLNLPFTGAIISHSAPNSPARSTFPSSIPSSKQAFAHSVSPPSPSAYSFSHKSTSSYSYNHGRCAKGRNGSTTSLNHVPHSGKKYDLSGHVKQPLYCPSINRRAASDGDMPQEEADNRDHGSCKKARRGDEEDEMLFPLPKNRTPSPIGGCGGSTGSLERCEQAKTVGKVEEQEKEMDVKREVKKEVKEQKKVESYFDEEFALPSRRSRPTPPSSSSPSIKATSTAPSSFTAPHTYASPSNPPQQQQQPLAPSTSPSPPPVQKPRNLAFIPRRGPTSILPPIPGSRPTSSHSRTFSDSQLPRSSTSSLRRRGDVGEGIPDAESIARALANAVAESQGETRVLGDATNSPTPTSSGKLKRTTTAPTNGNSSRPGTPRERSVSASESVGHSHNAGHHPASASVPSTPTMSSASPQMKGSPASGGRQVQKRKPSFSLRMKHLKEVGADVWRGVGSIGSGVGRLA